jgi:hypothetical protein
VSSSTVVCGWGAGDDERRAERRAVGERHAGHRAAGDVDRRHRRTRPDGRAVRLGGAREREADRAAHMAPRAARPVERAELVVEQVVRGARRARPGPYADDAGRRDAALERVVLEPLVEQVADRHRHQPVQLVHPRARQARAARRPRDERGQVAGIGASRRRAAA